MGTQERIDYSSIDNKIKYEKEPSEKEFQEDYERTILVNSNGITVIADYMDNISVDTDDFYMITSVFFNSVSVRNKKSDKWINHMPDKEFFQITRMPSPDKLRTAEEANRYLRRLFVLRAFL